MRDHVDTVREPSQRQHRSRRRGARDLRVVFDGQSDLMADTFLTPHVRPHNGRLS
jgi:hypothetical protein